MEFHRSTHARCSSHEPATLRSPVVSQRASQAAPARGAPLRHDGKDVGRLTSIARARGGDELVGLALVRREHWAPGSELEAETGRARVAAFPLA